MSSIENPNEVVTKALLRFVDVDGARAAVITLDNGFDHTKPNSFGVGGLTSLDSALDEALAADPAFVAVTGRRATLRNASSCPRCSPMRLSLSPRSWFCSRSFAPSVLLRCSST